MIKMSTYMPWLQSRLNIRMTIIMIICRMNVNRMTTEMKTTRTVKMTQTLQKTLG